MVLVDHEIRQLCEMGLVTPFDEARLNPASLDILVGETAVIETEQGWQNIHLNTFNQSSPYWLEPGEFILVASQETFNLPNTIAGEFRLKSSRAREGFDQTLAVWLDPGWNGSKLTMELKNNCRFHWLPLYPGQKIGQVFFHQVTQPERSYAFTGRYNGDAKVSGSKAVEVPGRRMR